MQESKPQLITAHDLPMNESEFYDSDCIYNVQDFQNKDSHYIKNLLPYWDSKCWFDTESSWTSFLNKFNVE